MSRKRKGPNQTKRTVYRLSYHGKNCLFILKQILPYLIEKKSQAEAVFEVQRLRDKISADKKVDHGASPRKKDTCKKIITP